MGELSGDSSLLAREVPLDEILGSGCGGFLPGSVRGLMPGETNNFVLGPSYVVVVLDIILKLRSNALWRRCFKHQILSILFEIVQCTRYEQS